MQVQSHRSRMKPFSIITTKGLTKYYPVTRRKWGIFPSFSTPARPAVDSLDLEIERGEFFGLLGQNGAGKTTLIRMLSTLILPTSGSARINGHDLKNLKGVKRSIGVVSGDERSFFWRLTGRQNLLFFAALEDLRPHEATRRVEDLLDLIGLTESADDVFRSYSTGMKQRLSIARALLHKPPILFLDEPTKGLDPLAMKNVHDLFRVRLNREENITIFMTTHRLDEAEKLCDRLAIMHRGRVLAEGTVAELCKVQNPGDKYRITAAGITREIVSRIEEAAGGPEGFLFDDLNGTIRFEVPGKGSDLGRAVDIVRNGGGTVIDIRLAGTSLESVYEAIVGSHQGPVDENEEEI